jgi:hypothetical protein
MPKYTINAEMAANINRIILTRNGIGIMIAESKENSKTNNKIM